VIDGEKGLRMIVATSVTGVLRRFVIELGRLARCDADPAHRSCSVLPSDEMSRRWQRFAGAKALKKAADSLLWRLRQKGRGRMLFWSWRVAVRARRPDGQSRLSPV